MRYQYWFRGFCLWHLVCWPRPCAVASPSPRVGRGCARSNHRRIRGMPLASAGQPWERRPATRGFALVAECLLRSGPKRTVGRCVSFRRALALPRFHSRALYTLENARIASLLWTRLQVVHSSETSRAHARKHLPVQDACARVTLNRDVSWGMIFTRFSFFLSYLTISLILWYFNFVFDITLGMNGRTLVSYFWALQSPRFYFLAWYLACEFWWGIAESLACTCMGLLTIYSRLLQRSCCPFSWFHFSNSIPSMSILWPRFCEREGSHACLSHCRSLEFREI